MRAWSFAHLCLILCNPKDCRLPGSSLHVIFSGKNTGVGCISSSRGSYQARGWTCVSFVSCSGRWILSHCATWEAHSYSRSFYLSSISFRGSYPRHHITFSICVFLDSSWLWQFLRLPLFLMTLTVLSSPGVLRSLCCRCPSLGIWIMFFSWLDRGYGFWGRSQR